MNSIVNKLFNFLCIKYELVNFITVIRVSKGLNLLCNENGPFDALILL